ncbi:MAG: O-antigen ligase family protein [Pseudomonadota bacterium]
MLAFPVLLLLLAAYALIQLIPLPVDVWSSLPERTAIVEGWALLGLSADRVFPISLSPSETRTALLGIVPPIAMFLVLCAVGWRRAIWPFFWLIPVLGAVSALLGIAQVVSGNGAQLSWHDVANHGSAIGVFANANHQASFCLMCLPFTAALAGRHRQDWNAGDDDVAIAIAIFGLFALNLVGVLAGGSVAGYLLLIPVGVFSAFLLFGIRTKEGQRPILLYATMAGSIAAAVVLVVSSPVLDGLGITSFGDGDLTRRGIWSTSTEIATDQLATGAGLGTFTEAYRLYENDSNITTRFVNNAHNDYLQIAAELGVFGIALLGLGLSAFAILFFQSWTTRIDRDYRFRRAASVALLVPILHSLVDYPVRTPAIACLVAVCFAIMVLPRNRIVEPKPTETRPGHVSI